MTWLERFSRKISRRSKRPRIDTLHSCKRIALTSKRTCQLRSNLPPSCSTSARYKPIWQNRRIIRRLTRSSRERMLWSHRSKRAIWTTDRRKSLQLRQSWCKSNRTRWMLCVESLKIRWTNISRRENKSITRFFRTMKTLKNRSKISRRWSATSWNNTTKRGQARQRAVSWEVSQGWPRREWEDPTPPREWSEVARSEVGRRERLAHH